MNREEEEKVILYGRNVNLKLSKLYKCDNIKYEISIEEIPNNNSQIIINVLKHSAPSLFQTMIETTEKLKCLKKFISNGNIDSQMIFCDFSWAPKFFGKKKENEKIYCGHHILLLIPVKDISKLNKEKIKQNIEKSFKNSKADLHKFTTNMLEEFNNYEKIWLSEIPCKMLIDFQHIFINTLEDLHKDSQIILNGKTVIPVYAINGRWDNNQRISDKISISAIKLGFLSSEILEILYNSGHVGADDEIVGGNKDESNKTEIDESLKVIIQQLLEFCKNEIMDSDFNSKLYSLLIKYHSKFWNENYKEYFLELEERHEKNVLKSIYKKIKNLKTKNDEILLEAFEAQKNEKDSSETANCQKFLSQKCKTDIDQRHFKDNQNDQICFDKSYDKSAEIKFDIKAPESSLKLQQQSESVETDKNLATENNHISDGEEDYVKIDKKSIISSSHTTTTLSPVESDTVESLMENASNNFVPSNNIISVPPKQKSKYNIILIGESGSGKSTFINAFQNYLKFSSLEKAINSEKIECLIPVKFNIHTNSTTFEDIIIEYGKSDDKNESFDDISQSCTKLPKKYTIEFESYDLTIIDTPGSSDTRGFNQDHQNFSLIKTAANEMEKIDAICLTILANQTKFSPGFEARMKGLLSLFSSSNPNVFFFFTNVGANHYYIGDAMLVIRELVKSYNSSNIYANLKLDQSNVYSIENEGFRFLIAKKVGKIYTAQSEENCKKSWEHSVQEVERFLATIIDKNEKESDSSPEMLMNAD